MIFGNISERSDDDFERTYDNNFDKTKNTKNTTKKRGKSSNPILWPSGGFRNPQKKNFGTMKENINFNAIDFLLREEEKTKNLPDFNSSYIDMEERQKVFEEVIIERVQKLQM